MISQKSLTLFYRNNYSYCPQQDTSEAISKLISSQAVQYVFSTHTCISKSVTYLTAQPFGVPLHSTFSISENPHTAMQIVTLGLPDQNYKQPNEYVVSGRGIFRI